MSEQVTGEGGAPFETLASSGRTIATRTLTGAVDALVASSVPVKTGVVVQADATNTAGTYVEVGFADLTAGNGLQLGPGDSQAFPVTNANGLYVIGTAGQKVRAVAVGA